jgi:RNA polymerase sigma factor (sigma-70 family)
MPDDEKVQRFAELYVRYGKRLRAYFFTKGFDRDTAQDLTHDVFIAFLPIPPEKIDSEEAYLWTIARNLVAQKHRPTRRTLLPSAAETLNEDLHHGSLSLTPAQAEFDAFTTEYLRQAIAQLSSGKQALIELRLAGYEDAEIAARLGLPVGTVQSRFVQIRAELRRILAGKSGRETAR